MNLFDVPVVADANLQKGGPIVFIDGSLRMHPDDMKRPVDEIAVMFKKADEAYG